MSQGTFIRSWVPEAAVFAAAFLLQLLILSQFAASPFFLPESDDMHFYNEWALRIRAGHFTDGQAFYGLPGYAWCLAAIYSVAGYNPFAVGLLQSAMSALISAMICRIARVIFGNESQRAGDPSQAQALTIGILAAMAWALFQPAQGFSIILMPTVWLVLAFWACVWWVAKTRTSTPVRPWLWIGLVTGLISVLVATILFLIPLYLAGIALTVNRSASAAGSLKGTGRRLPGMLAAVALMFAGIFCGMAPAWAHNYFIAKEPVLLSAHSGINFWIGNNPNATGYPKMPPGIRTSQAGLLMDSITLAEAEAGRPLKRHEVSRHWSEKANAYIRENRGEWLRLIGVKLKNFWNAYQYDDLAILKLLRDHGVLPPGLRFGLIAALALPGLLLAGWRFPRLRWVVAAVLLHMAALIPVFVTERYRLAAVPGLCLLAVVGLWQLWDAILQRRWKWTAAYLGLLAGSVWFVSLPQREIGLWSLDFYKAGIRATDLGEFEQAQRNLDMANRYAPNSADIQLALGNLWLARGDRPQAKAHYRRAFELNPRHERVLNNLGVLALEEKFYAFAERCFLTALEMEPANAKLHYLLAKTRFESGNAAGAQEPLRRALELRPEQPEFRELQDQLEAASPAAPVER